MNAILPLIWELLKGVPRQPMRRLVGIAAAIIMIQVYIDSLAPRPKPDRVIPVTYPPLIELVSDSAFKVTVRFDESVEDCKRAVVSHAFYDKHGQLAGTLIARAQNIAAANDGEEPDRIWTSRVLQLPFALDPAGHYAYVVEGQCLSNGNTRTFSARMPDAIRPNAHGGP